MSKIQFDVNVANGVAIDVANDVLPVWWMEVYPFVLTNQNHCYMQKLNDSAFMAKIDSPAIFSGIFLLYSIQYNTNFFWWPFFHKDTILDIHGTAFSQVFIS